MKKRKKTKQQIKTHKLRAKGKKRCSFCKQVKSLSDFYSNKSAWDGCSNDCRECAKEYRKQRRRNPLLKEKNKRSQRKYTLKKLYNLTVDQHRKMYIVQNGCCAICGSPISYDNIATDHNHTSGKIRGLLCHSCNKGLGHFKEDKNTLFEAIKYLNERN